MAEFRHLNGRQWVYQIPERHRPSRYDTPGTYLAQPGASWHGARMEQQSGNASRAGGAIIAFSILAGAITGNHFGQPSIGMVTGTGIGVVIALVLYLYDRRRG